MERTEITNNDVQARCDEASLPQAALHFTQDEADEHAAAEAGAKKQGLELVRAADRPRDDRSEFCSKLSKSRACSSECLQRLMWAGRHG